MPITLDASATAAWLLPDEANDAADLLYQRALGEDELFQAPAVWAWESGNLLRAARRRGRLTPQQLTQAVRLLHRARVRLEAAPDQERMLSTLAHAEREGLSFYDASYLEQAFRTGAQLATKDDALRRAALRIGVVCIDV